MKECSQKTFAEMTGFSAGAVSAFIRQGLPATPTKRGRATVINIPAGVQWLLARERERAKPQHADPRNALYEEQRRKVWLENEATEMQMVKLEDVQVVINEAMVAIASELEAMPGRLAGRLAGITEPALIRQALRIEITNIRQAAADRLARLGALDTKPLPAPTGKRPRLIKKKSGQRP